MSELLSDGDKRYLIGHYTLGWEDAGGWTYAVPDALGSVRQAVDGVGELVENREWSPYGVEVGEAQAGLGYTGEWWDAAVGLQWYEVAMDSFLTPNAVRAIAFGLHSHFREAQSRLRNPVPAVTVLPA